MKKPLFLFLLSCLLPFFYTYSVHAEVVTYENPKCQNISPCLSKGDGNMFLGLPDANRQNEDQFLLKTCQYLSFNNNSTYLGHSVFPSSTYIVYSFDYRTFYAFMGKQLTSITCEVPPAEILGCTNPQATNYNSQANKDDGSCILPPPPVAGCTDPTALNYNLLANQDDGSCVAKVEGCTDSIALNYNPQANVHIESVCQYPPTYTPTNITGSIPTTQVNKGATQWNVQILTSHTGTIIDTSRIQLWEQFTVVDASTNDKTITLSLRQFDDQRLDVECTNYEITVPAEAITTQAGDTNSNPITGNFSVIGCDNSPNPQNPTDTEIPKIDFPNAELNQESQYLQIIGQKDGYYYVDLKSLTILFFYLLLSFSIFYVLFKFFNKKIP